MAENEVTTALRLCLGQDISPECHAAVTAGLAQAVRVERELADATALLDLIREEAGKSNSPYGRSDSIALYNIREALSIPKYGFNGPLDGARE